MRLNPLREWLKMLVGTATAGNWRDAEVARVRLAYLWDELRSAVKEVVRYGRH